MGKKLIVKIDQILQDRNISLRELSRRSDVRHAALSEMSNQKRERISGEHVGKIVDALGIHDVREIFDLVECDE